MQSYGALKAHVRVMRAGLTASGRETASQREALRALHRRRDAGRAAATAAAEAAASVRERVRTYAVVRGEA
jgi:hypothetical protein